MTSPRTLSTTEAAERSGLSEVRLRAMAQNGEIKGAKKEGREWRFSATGLPERQRGGGTEPDELGEYRTREGRLWRALEERDQNVAESLRNVTEALASVKQALANNQTLATLAERLSRS